MCRVADDETAIFLDEGAYSISRWGVERATYRHTPVCVFRHHDAEHLEFMLSENQVPARRPIVLVDGVSGTDWMPAPLSDYLGRITPHNGLLIVDDTQSIGLLGHSPSPDSTYGVGGGGSLRWHEIESPAVLLVASLAKAFSVPIAVVSGSRRLTDWLSASSQTRLHCSPPSIPTFCALEHALDVNQVQGDELRKRLGENVRQVSEILAPLTSPTGIPYFPVQCLPLPPEINTSSLDLILRNRGVRVAFQRSAGGITNIVLIMTSAHCPSALEFAIKALLETLDELKSDSRNVDPRSHDMIDSEPAFVAKVAGWGSDRDGPPFPLR